MGCLMRMRRHTWQCIWDTGGTDTIVYDGRKNATIDLRAARS